FNNLNRYDIGSGPLPWGNAPNLAINLGSPTTQNDIAVDVDIDPSGNIFGGFNRTDKSAPCLQAFAPGSSTPYYSSYDSGNNIEIITNGCYTMRVSPDGKYVACMSTANLIYVMSIINGSPDPTTLFTIPNTPTTGNGRNIAWDAADNIYEVSSGQALLRCYSLGQTTTAITSNDSTGVNGSFALVVPPYNISLQASTPVASQNYGSPIPGVFTITRSSGDVTKALTVNFTLSGTATNGTYTTPVTTNITFAPNQTTTNINITPTATPLTGPTLNLVLSLQPSQSYIITPPASATISILNTGPQYVFASGVVAPGKMYRGHASDYAFYVVTRWGDTNPPSGAYTVNMTYSGSAVLGTDYLSGDPTVTINPGDVTVVGTVSQPVKNTTYSGDKIITVQTASGSGYTVGTNIVDLTLLDNLYPAETVLWSDDLTTDTSANWTAMARTTAGPTTDYTASFGYPIGNDLVGNAPNGASTALKVTCNKSAGAAAGLNVFPTGRSFSNNFALRFDMNLIQDQNLSTATESALFGINHAGNNVNWLSSSAAGTGSADGVWYTISSDAGGALAGDFFEFSGATLRSAVTSAGFTNSYKHPGVYTSVFTGGGTGAIGVPANATGLATEWASVEIKQSNNVVTLSIDHMPIYVYTNTTAFTNGAVMLGYDDPFGSIGSTGAAYYSHARVVDLGFGTAVAPRITSVSVSGANVIISFTTTSGSDTTSAFVLQSVGNIAATFTDVAPAATITGGSGSFQATIPVGGATQFYRIRHN
ncbi:MAG: Calx-beta domain-containing protein, partial [Limisphaerales bacterium]